MGSTIVTPPVVKAKALSCPNCGGPVELRGFAHTLSAVCPHCLSILDTSGPLVSIVYKAQSQQRFQPLIPLGTRGRFGETVYEAIGFQFRKVVTDDGDYGWSEYLLFNPYKGFAYLSEYHGHWNFIHVLRCLPEPAGPGPRNGVRYQGKDYKHFGHYDAITTYVLGEFPWQVRAGERNTLDDFISPPYMLSSEATAGEATWSQGTYVPGQQIWQIFKLPGAPPPSQGVYGNQPSPLTDQTKSAWRMFFFFMVALLVTAFTFGAMASHKEVFRHSYTFTPGGASEPIIVTNDFDVPGRTSNLELTTTTDLRHQSAYFVFALINRDNERPINFARNVQSQGDRPAHDRVLIPHVIPGKYYLRVEPEINGTTAPINYELIVRRDVPSFGWFWLAALLLLIPPFITTLRGAGFESARWRESDFLPTGEAA